MLNVAFWYEFRRQSAVVIWLALLNPVLLAAHAWTADLDRPALEFWLIGLGVNFLLCLMGAAIVYASTVVAIRRGIDFVTREKQWDDIVKRGPFMRSFGKTGEAG